MRSASVSRSRGNSLENSTEVPRRRRVLAYVLGPLALIAVLGLYDFFAQDFLTGCWTWANAVASPDAALSPPKDQLLTAPRKKKSLSMAQRKFAEARAWSIYREYMTHVPLSAGEAGAVLDCGEMAELPKFGLELEFLASTPTCNYSFQTFQALAARVTQLVGVNREGVKESLGGTEGPMIKFRDSLERKWEVHSDFLTPNPIWSKLRGSSGISKSPGYEVTTPPITSAVFALRLMQWLHSWDGLAVIFPCTLRGTEAIHKVCDGSILSQPDHQRTSWRDDCGNHTGKAMLDVPALIPTFHVHVDATGLCTASGSCRGLVNLILLHEKYEFVLRRLFPIYGPTDNAVPLRLGAPGVLNALSELSPDDRTWERVRHIFQKYERKMRYGLCVLEPPGSGQGVREANVQKALQSVGNMKAEIAICERKLPPAVVWRWWSFKPFTILNLENYSHARSTVEFRGTSMGNGAYPLMLRTQLCRLMVRRAVQLRSDLTWQDPPEEDRVAQKEAGRMVFNGDAPWGAAVRRVTRSHMRAFIDSMGFGKPMRRLYYQYIDTL